MYFRDGLEEKPSGLQHGSAAEELHLERGLAVNVYWAMIAVINLFLGVAAGWVFRGWTEYSFANTSTAPSSSPAKRSSVRRTSRNRVPATGSQEHSPHQTTSTRLKDALEKQSDLSSVPPAAREAMKELEHFFQEVSDSDELVLCAVFVLNRESSQFIQRLLDVEKQTRLLIENPDEEKLNYCIRQLEQISQQWLSIQQSTVDQLARHGGSMRSEGSDQLERLLLERAAQLEEATNNLKKFDFSADPAQGAQRLLREILALINQMRALVEQTSRVSLETAMDSSTRAEPAQTLLEDPLTGLPTHLGMCRLVEQWRKADPHGMRQASVVLVDVDQMAKFNERFGTQNGDRLLESLGKALPQTIRQNRGFDRVGRYNGDRFLLFLGDSSPHNASVVAERIRQSVEQAQFLTAEGPVQITVSCGVVEALPGDTFQNTCARVETTLRSAKQQGRNRTMVHDGSSINVVQAPPLKTPDWSFSLEDSA